MTTEPTTVLHDPREHIRGLQQLLISDTKRIGFLFGAGTSMARKGDVGADHISGYSRLEEKEVQTVARYMDVA